MAVALFEEFFRRLPGYALCNMISLVHLVHPDDQHVLIIGTVENPDIASARDAFVQAPQKVVRQFFRRRRSEIVHLDALRIDTSHHMLDGAVLPGSVHRLQNNDQAFSAVSIQTILQFLHLCKIFLRFCNDLFFINFILFAVCRKLFQFQFSAAVKCIIFE